VRKQTGEIVDQIRGKIKQAAGGRAGNNKLENEGKVDEAKGKMKGAVVNRNMGQMANILIIDDDFDIVDASRLLLESVGHCVRIGHSGEEGLASLAKAALPDCLLLDVDMPTMNGPGMAHQMLLHDAGEEKIPILLVSGRNDLPAVAARMGTPYFLAKGSADYGEVLLQLLGRAIIERRAPATA
jgi:FixJ family two-component response regulator/uncharacterized protein YjbJ (UPF0337 family)